MKKRMALVLTIAGTMALAAGCGSKEAALKDGSYDGVSETSRGTVNVTVDVTEGKISAVTVGENSETPEIAGDAIESIPAAIVEKNSADVEAVSGATETSTAIKEAVLNALEGAK